jgi:hypothetical protein
VLLLLLLLLLLADIGVSAGAGCCWGLLLLFALFGRSMPRI